LKSAKGKGKALPITYDPTLVPYALKINKTRPRAEDTPPATDIEDEEDRGTSPYSLRLTSGFNDSKPTESTSNKPGSYVHPLLERIYAQNHNFDSISVLSCPFGHLRHEADFAINFLGESMDLDLYILSISPKNTLHTEHDLWRGGALNIVEILRFGAKYGPREANPPFDQRKLLKTLRSDAVRTWHGPSTRCTKITVETHWKGMLATIDRAPGPLDKAVTGYVLLAMRPVLLTSTGGVDHGRMEKEDAVGAGFPPDQAAKFQHAMEVFAFMIRRARTDPDKAALRRVDSTPNQLDSEHTPDGKIAIVAREPAGRLSLDSRLNPGYV
jgi:hypothetical protein